MKRLDPFTPGGSAANGPAILENPPPQSQPSTPPTKGAGTKSLKKISFGAAKVKAEDTKTAYPVFDDPNGQAAIIAARIKTRQEEIEVLQGALITDKAELRIMVNPFYFTVNRGKAEPPSSVSVRSPEGEVLVTYQNRYSQLETEEPIIAILGEEKTGDYFRQTFELKIKGEQLPVGAEQAIVDEVMAVLAKHNAGDALEVKAGVKPTKDFHTKRHTAFTPEINLALDEACPIIAMVKTKGRGAK